MSAANVMETCQYLTFKLGQEDFALEINTVREVLDLINITKIPRTPDYMKGVINLRGNVVPIIDLRLNLGMESAERTVDTCIIIVEVDFDGEAMQIGALADSVQEVIDIDPDNIEPAPKIGINLNTDFIKGMGKRDDKFIIILDINKVLSSEELTVLKAASGAGADN
ncbi:MAG: chemotaxis protein CheW [Sedimentisphaerales bacterium]|nr:chemotaxis protein CheW [Sedimentisphaerales bacterium]MBN2842806.1 chemotaxis protein CheW [Sedimentisphaerales bacterium]